MNDYTVYKKKKKKGRKGKKGKKGKASKGNVPICVEPRDRVRRPDGGPPHALIERLRFHGYKISPNIYIYIYNNIYYNIYYILYIYNIYIYIKKF